MSEKGFSYVDVFYKMTPQQIAEANIALDIQQEAEKKQMKKKR